MGCSHNAGFDGLMLSDHASSKGLGSRAAMVPSAMDGLCAEMHLGHHSVHSMQPAQSTAMLMSDSAFVAQLPCHGITSAVCSPQLCHLNHECGT